MDQLSDQSMDQLSDQSMDQLNDQSMDQLSHQSMDQLSDQSMDQLSDQSMDHHLGQQLDQTRGHRSSQQTDHQLDQTRDQRSSQQTGQRLDQTRDQRISQQRHRPDELKTLQHNHVKADQPSYDISQEAKVHTETGANQQGPVTWLQGSVQGARASGMTLSTVGEPDVKTGLTSRHPPARREIVKHLSRDKRGNLFSMQTSLSHSLTLSSS